MKRIFMAVLLAAVVLSEDRVLFKDVTALTLRAGAMTTGRRSAPIPQLQCRGRTCSKFQEQVVQCIRTGWDGRDATWRCEADLPPNISFGKVTVSCEGYGYADDPYILAGSCGLKYQLVDATHVKNEQEELWTVGIFVALLITVGIVALFVTKCCSRSHSTGGGGGAMPPPPPYDDYYRMPNSDRSSYSRPSATPSSAECRPEPSQASSGPGFFTGLGIGGLTGYALGNRARRHVYTTSAYDYPRTSSNGWGWGWGSSASSSSTSSSSTLSAPTRTTFGYATTERR